MVHIGLFAVSNNKNEKWHPKEEAMTKLHPNLTINSEWKSENIAKKLSSN